MSTEGKSKSYSSRSVRHFPPEGQKEPDHNWRCDLPNDPDNTRVLSGREVED